MPRCCIAFPFMTFSVYVMPDRLYKLSSPTFLRKQHTVKVTNFKVLNTTRNNSSDGHIPLAEIYDHTGFEIYKNERFLFSLLGIVVCYSY